MKKFFNFKKKCSKIKRISLIAITILLFNLELKWINIYYGNKLETIDAHDPIISFCN